MITYDENANVEIGTDKLYSPWYFDFDTLVPIDLAKTLDQFPNKAFSFIYNDETFVGFAIKPAIAPNDNKEQAFKLLAAPLTDMSKFV